jgi:hypothetical protein
VTETTELPRITPDAGRLLLSVPVTLDGAEVSTVGELLAMFAAQAWHQERRFACVKTEVYLAAVHAGLLPGVTDGDRISQDDIEAAEALTHAAILAMGQPPQSDLLALRARLAAVDELAREWERVAPESAAAACGRAMLAALSGERPE